jgi:hypothetical protein
MATRRSKAQRASAESALDAYKNHMREISTLLLNAQNKVDTDLHEATAETVHWGHVGTAAHVRELAVQMAFPLGTVSIEEAKSKHGVIL